MKLEVDIPKGTVCTGCPFQLIIANPDKMHYWGYGCSYLHDKCRAGGDFDNYGFKNKKCPSLTGETK